MLFNSLSFLVFFPLVTILYFLASPPSKTGLGHRWIVLLLSSCLFYMWFIPQYILILALTIVVDYFAGIYIEKSEGKKRKKYLALSIITTCAILFFFKYFNFFNANFEFIAKSFGLNYPIGALRILLPIGLSFHTFQSLSYVIEVYRGNQRAEKHFGIFSLYVMFYPQLVAGPIERPQNLLHQFREHYTFDYERVTSGLKLMAWGLFKKVVIADRLAFVVGNVYSSPYEHSGVALSIATVFFAFQIYCDFSGYSDVAIGSAQVMGFKLMDNFNRPYFSKSISEFWKRWHISLSTWFKDYFYLSLGGNRCSKPRWQFNLFLTFLVSGLWHGANWTYVAWGAVNGFYLVFAIWTKQLRSQIFEKSFAFHFPRIFKLYQVLITFFLVCIAWVFFRAANIKEAIYIIGHFNRGWTQFFELLRNGGLHFNTTNGLGLGVSMYSIITSFSLIGFLICVHLLQRHRSMRFMLKNQPRVIRWSFYYAIVLAIIFLGVYGENQFIYFQF